MDNQHRLIKGYRDLTEKEIGVINDLKSIGESLDRALKSVETLPGIDPRWLAIGKTNLQQGIMAVVRSVARPDGF